MSKQGSNYYDGPYGRIVGISAAKRRAYENAPQWHEDPFDPEEDRWPGDKFQKYTWDGNYWIAVGATDNAIDDSGGV